MHEEYSAGAIIFRKEKEMPLFLILHYEEGHWGASKGHIEKGETLEQTALREIREETGLTEVCLIDGFKTENSYIFNKNGRLTRKVVVFFLVETHSREIILSAEHVNYAWLPFRDATEKVTFKSEQLVWQAAYEFLQKIQSK